MWCGDRGVTHKGVKRKNDFSFGTKTLEDVVGFLCKPADIFWQISRLLLLALEIFVEKYRWTEKCVTFSEDYH